MSLALRVASLFAAFSASSSSVAPHSCAPTSPLLQLAPEACNLSLPFAVRAAAILALLNTTERVNLFGALTQSHDFIPYNARTNIKSFLWVTTCIHGLAANPSPPHNNTVFPHAASLGATFDTALVTAVSLATATEARIIAALNYEASNGTQLQSLSCAGGPLANTVHDNRWGRAAEAYSEDPMHAAAIGVAAMTALQNRSQPTSAGETFVAMTTTIRHWLGFHQAQGDASSGLPDGGVETISPRWLFDQQVPVYRALAVDAQAEGVMCSMNSLNGVPACANRPLFSLLREQWNSSAIVQTDCCDSLSTAVNALKYYATLEDAVVDSMHAGLQGLFTTNPLPGVAALASAVADGRVEPALLDAAIMRQLVARFRVGEFDTENPENPYREPPPSALLDGPAHRALARRTVTSSIVLLENLRGALPLAPLAGKRVAVIGPFSNCTAQGAHDDRPDGSACSYSHSYAGLMSNPSTVLSAALAEVAAAGGGATVTFAQGSGITEALPGGVAGAVAVASAADVVVVVLGLGQLVEREGLNRNNFSLPQPQVDLLAAVSAASGAARLVLILVNAGGVDLGATPTAFAHAIALLGYAGAEAGNGLWDVLLGRKSPAGRLPSTWYKSSYLEHVPPLSNFDLVDGATGVGRTYRFVDETYVAYRFGHGLSYSRFEYSALSAMLLANCSVDVTVDVENVGDVDAEEVVQVYVRVPHISVVTPPFALVAFTRVMLIAGAPPTTLRFLLPRDSLASTLDDGNRSIADGAFLLYAGGSLPTDVNTSGNIVNTTFVVAAGGACSNSSAAARATPTPLTTTGAPLVVDGFFDAETGPSSIVSWQSALVIFETIFCGYWDHAGTYNASFAGHSYFRVRDASTGRVITNVSASIGFAYGSAFVDHDANGRAGRFWMFGTPHDRCHNPVLANDTGVYAFFSDDAALTTWTRARTDISWNENGTGYNTAVARVDGVPPPGLPAHRFIMVTDHCEFFINNDAGGDLRAGWSRVDTANASAVPDACQCPSIKYFDGFYYVLAGGHAIWLLRSQDLREWSFPAAGRRPIISHSAADGVVSTFAGAAANVAASDVFYRAQGKNTTSEMLENLWAWDFNSNDADMCCEDGVSMRAFINFGASAQTAKPLDGLTGPDAVQVVASANVTLDAMLRELF